MYALDKHTNTSTYTLTHILHFIWTHTHYPHSLTRLMSMRVYAFSLSCRLSSKSSAYFRAYLSLTLPSSFVGVALTPSSAHFNSSIWRPLKHALITCSSSLCRGPFQHRALSTFAPWLMACEMLIICLLLLATQLFHPPFVRISRSFCLFSLLWLAIFCTFKLQLFARLAGRFATNMALKRKWSGKESALLIHCRNSILTQEFKILFNFGYICMCTHIQMCKIDT